jgi:uncharacterized protein (TIGR02145 family)
MKNILAILICFYPVLLFAQEITINEVSQENNSVIIQYDLQGAGTFNVKIYYSTDDGKSWKGPLNQLTGAAGEKQTQGENKVVVWNILAEKTEISGFYQFKILAELENQFASDSGTFTDERDGQVYKWVKISEQVWMAENLKATRYNDGTPIRNVINDREWEKLKSGAYCLYEDTVEVYGLLYNWYAVNTGKLCPIGWRVPSDNDWYLLGKNLVRIDESGKEMSEYWKIRKHYIVYRTIFNGFSGVPGGYRNPDGSFGGIEIYGSWWSSTKVSRTNAWYRSLNFKNMQLTRFGLNKQNGFSICCIKD